MISRNLCQGRFRSLPRWPCAACHAGRLVQKKLDTEADPGYRERRRAGISTPLEEYGVFTAMMRCDNPTCTQFNTLCGYYIADGLETSEEFGSIVSYQYYPLFVHRPVALIEIPKDASPGVKANLERAFSLFWNDLAAAANAIRSAIEGSLDELNIPRTTANGGFRNLASR